MRVNGVWHTVRVLLGGFLADLEEQYHLLNQKAAGSKHPDIRYLVPHDKLTDLRGKYGLRTEPQHQQVIASTVAVATCCIMSRIVNSALQCRHWQCGSVLSSPTPPLS